MYHPLLACFSKVDTVIPNDIVTTANQNVRLITGANNNAFRDFPCVAQLCCKLDHAQKPPAYTYKIKPGISGDSDGLTVASEYGVNKKNLEALLEQKARRGDFKLR